MIRDETDRKGCRANGEDYGRINIDQITVQKTIHASTVATLVGI